ncbi:MAG: hypothetical protein A2340_16170 [Lentisphaerae bacterium RIFOXYB12_FULL_60_10]|nr:MAG: hypothetical protein A2340_16170 [Lentisphaerae bacterium RIFOXYB12_FULL_60_10]
MISQRERFCRTYDFQSVDRPPRWEAVSFWQETIDAWQAKGGLPESVRDAGAAGLHYGIEPWIGISGGLGLTGMALQGPPVQWKTIQQDGASSVTESDLGAVVRQRTDGGTSMPQFIRFPVESKEDWERKIKPRYRPEGHVFAGLEDEARRVKSLGDIPISLYLVGLYAFWRNFWGEEKLAYAFYDEPDTLHDMAKTWLAMHAANVGRVLAAIPCDWTLFHEDMACKGGPLIGPDMFREFMTPYYRELLQQLRSLGQHRLAVDSDGDNKDVLECFVDLGINGLYPFEVAAGSNALAFRKKHPDFVVLGALDKRVLLQSREAIRREVMEKVPVLWEQGGFIPSVDHSVPPCPREHFEYFLECVRSVFG